MRGSFLALSLVASALLLASCGGSGPTASRATDARGTSAGARVFATSGCGTCHTLAAAHTTGSVGPNLDELQPTKAEVAQQVRTGGGGMPAFGGKLTRSQIDEVAGFVSSSASAAPPSGGQASGFPIGFSPNSQKLASCRSGNIVCYLQAFGNLSYHRGPRVALALLRQKMATDPAIEAVCHPIAHSIGAGALLRYHKNVGKAFGQGDPTCGSGYYHGLLQWKLAGVMPSHVASVARTVCTNPTIRANAFDYYQCVHGLGHGLMLYTRYDLPKALQLCHELATNYDQISCTGGVFMENQQSSYGIRSKWLRTNDLLYPCDVVKDRDKLYCYLLVTSHILPNVGWNWTKAADWCRKSDPGFVRYCFQSYGRDASGQAREQPSGILSNCSHAGSGKKECIFGAVRDILNNNPRDIRSRELCSRVQKAFRSYCSYGIGSMVGSYYSTGEQNAACRRLSPAAYLSDCVEGAGAAARP